MSKDDFFGFLPSEKFALELDHSDPLKSYRSRFYIPDHTIYLDGNSLGLLSIDAEKNVLRVLDEWKKLGIKGWSEGAIPWFNFSEQMGERICPLIGAKPSEVVMTGTTTINLHILLSTFYNPTNKRNIILADELNFPSDIYALRSHLKLRGFDPDTTLRLVRSSNGLLLEELDIISMMTPDVALILLPSVLYRSGQLLDIALLTKAAHERNILIGFDCSHSVGGVPHHFDQWEVDFAFWCSYKYLNGGPGSSAFIYINQKHHHRESGIQGWFGYVKSEQFDMNLEFHQAKNAGGWQISSPGIIAAGAVEGALNLTLEAGIENIRQKSWKMTAYLIYLVDHLLSKSPYNIQIATPRDIKRRSGHIALKRNTDAARINKALLAHGIIPDFRPPNIIRVAPIALYNTYLEIWQFIHKLKSIIDTKEYLQYSDQRNLIA